VVRAPVGVNVRAQLEQARRATQPDVVLGVLAVVLMPFLVDGFIRRELYATSPGLYWAFDALKFVAMPGVAAILLARRFGISPRDYGIRGVAASESWGHFISLTAFLALVLALVYYAALYVACLIFRPEVAPSFYQGINPQGLLRLPVILYLSVTAAVVEEVIYRGLPLWYLERRFNDLSLHTPYAIGTAILFGLIHWENGVHEIVATFAFGVLAAVLYLRLRDLWPLIGAHFVIDMWTFW
jgi:membrane protease YdiL (CAAX protease family)